VLKLFDYDNDGNLDLFLANGHPDDKIEIHSSHVSYEGAVPTVSQQRERMAEREPP
jgi:hypothetical protein